MDPNKRTEWTRTNWPNGPEQRDRMDPNKLTAQMEQTDRMDLTLSDRMDPNKGTEWTRTKGAIIPFFGPRHSFSNFKPCNFASQPLGKLIRLGRGETLVLMTIYDPLSVGSYFSAQDPSVWCWRTGGARLRWFQDLVHEEYHWKLIMFDESCWRNFFSCKKFPGSSFESTVWDSDICEQNQWGIKSESAWDAFDNLELSMHLWSWALTCGESWGTCSQMLTSAKVANGIKGSYRFIPWNSSSTTCM